MRIRTGFSVLTSWFTLTLCEKSSSRAVETDQFPSWRYPPVAYENSTSKALLAAVERGVSESAGWVEFWMTA